MSGGTSRRRRGARICIIGDAASTRRFQVCDCASSTTTLRQVGVVAARRVNARRSSVALVEPVARRPLALAEHQHGEVAPSEERGRGERADGAAEDDDVEVLGGHTLGSALAPGSRPNQVRSPVHPHGGARSRAAR